MLVWIRSLGVMVGSLFVLAWRFGVLYWRYAAAVLGAGALAWILSEAASDYTQGGWELHFEQRAWGLDLHIHHWYYGIPLVIIAFAMIVKFPVAAVFVFVFGQAVAAHSYYNEGGIPSIFEGGATLVVEPFLYWPTASTLVAIFTFFVVRSHEWLVVSSEREEAAQTYLLEPEACDRALAALDIWARAEFAPSASFGASEGARTATYSRLEEHVRGLWEIRVRATPFDDGRHLLTVRVEHFPYREESRRLLELLVEADAVIRASVPPGSPSIDLGSRIASLARE